MGAFRRFDPQKPLSAQRKSMLHAHRTHVIEAIKIRQRLDIGFVFDQLFGATMQQADMRIGTLHHLTLHFQDQAQHAMRGGVLRAEIDGVAVAFNGVADRLGLITRYGDCLALAHAGPSRRFSCTFSSPGSVVMPSQGLKKSKLRKSCCSVTGP